MTDRGTTPEVRALGADDLDEYYRVDSAAFGVRVDPRQVELKRRIVEPDRFLLARLDGTTVGVAGAFRFDLTVPGGAAVPVAGVSDVGVLPTHRRRGVLRSLVDRLFDDAASAGEVAALLTASQATIYGRFGFGVATWWRNVAIDTARAAFRPEAPVATGSVALVEREEAASLLPDVYRRSARNGSLTRTDAWWTIVLGEDDTWIGGHRDQRVVVHLGPDGSPDAYALYRMEEHWLDHGPHHRMAVREVVGVDVAAELALWRFLLDHDLVAEVTSTIPLDHVLLDVLVDVRGVRTTSTRDVLWCRPLDVERLLGARTYGADGALVLEVRDRTRPDVAGAYRVASAEGAGSCVRVDDPADVALDVEDLGACALGGASFAALARAGRVLGDPVAVARADGMFRTDPLPWTGTLF